MLTNKIAFLDYAGYHYSRRKRLTLSTKSYDNFLQIKFRALNRRCELLSYWGLSEKKINTFKNINYFNIIWSELGNIKNGEGTLKEKSDKINNILNDENIVENIKRFKPCRLKTKIKKVVFLLKNKRLLYLVIGK